MRGRSIALPELSPRRKLDLVEGAMVPIAVGDNGCNVCSRCVGKVDRFSVEDDGLEPGLGDMARAHTSVLPCR
jgi:hypothetical protein